MLKDFAGTVVFISHDRYLIEAIATHIWALDAGELHVLRGGWESYVRWRTELRAGTLEAAPPKRKDARTRREANLAAREAGKQRQRIQRKLDAVESEIEQIEAQLKELMDASGAAGEAGDLDRVAELGKQYTVADERLQELWRQYTELHDELDAL
jgi:ATP-binding cassette subfamily F protein 3